MNPHEPQSLNDVPAPKPTEPLPFQAAPSPPPPDDPPGLLERLRALRGEGDWGSRIPIRPLLVAALLLFALVALSRFVGRSFREVPPGSAAIVLNKVTGGATLRGPGAHFLPASLYHVSIVSISDRLLPESAATFNVSTKDGLTVSLEVQARWSVDRGSLLAKWSGLPPNPGETVVGPVLASAFRVVAPGYDATQILAAKREELTAAAETKAAERLRESGIVLKDLLIQNLTLPEEYQKGRLALLREGQEADRKEVTLRIREKEIEEGRLIAEAEKVKKEKAAEVEGFQRIKTAETDAAQKLIAAKADSDAMQYILPLKEKAIQQEKLMAEAEKQKRLKQAEAEAEAMKIQTAGDADKRRTLADADAYAIRVTSQAQFENLKKEVELVQANPVWVSKVFAEKISDKVQVILTPQLTSNVFNDEVLKRVANGKPAVARREITPVNAAAANAGASEPTAAARPTPTPAPEPEPADPDEGTR